MKNDNLKRLVDLVVFLVVLIIGRTDGVITIFNDGDYHVIDGYVADSVYVYDGPLGQPTTIEIINGAEIWGDVWLFGSSEAVVKGGYIYDDLGSNENAMIRITGGMIGTMCAGGNSHIIVTGGQAHSDCNIQDLVLNSNGRIEIYGNDFNYPYGEILDEIGEIRGFLEDNTYIEWLFRRQKIGLSTEHLVLVPEPCTAFLLSICSMVLLRKVRK